MFQLNTYQSSVQIGPLGSSMVNYESIYTSAGVNKASAVAACCPVSGLVAFGAGCQISLWNSEVRHEPSLTAEEWRLTETRF